MDLRAFFEAHPRVAIAFSGGVDSTYLVTAAAQYAQSVHAYTIDSVFVPRFELEGAKALTKKLGVAHTLLPIDVLQNETVVQNPKDRCYFCKKAVFFTIWEAAKKDGYDLLLDGTNASDDASDRPGMKALAELDVLSPLRLCGLTKTLIREKSRALGLPTWNKPSYACLATRIPTGEPITKEKLERTEWAETYLMGLGFSDFRVRLFAGCAKLQVKKAQLPLFLQHREDILAMLRTRYDGVFLDLEVR
ncbi:ATP-dependent sacrificial sulfur transferase LarE [uncultured Acidaminococcus sp.]|jgi:uncharacterized protein|uniref:ATP-dependent sacrificial sulfur transferase LarE n=1 Tax=Acidaminococcus sp. TaxID=1872103 RepID=UPI0025FA1EFF|nr:ATP-dependent sacrificial sulfur transferase LarE [uncultured Acidaminococcus sp.]